MAYVSLEIGLGKRCVDNGNDSQVSQPQRQAPSGKLSKQQSKFRKAVEKCHCKTKKSQTFGQCMSKELKKKNG